MYRTNMSSNRPLGRANNKEHYEVAKRVATEGIVLLKNKENFFPIKDKENFTIAVIGENATRSMTKGGGSSELKPKFEISPLKGLKKKYKKATILHSMGFETGPSEYDIVHPATLDADSLKTAAIALAKKADLVLFIGGLNKSHLQDCEGDDRQQYNLPFGQEDLLAKIVAVNKNTGFLLVTGNAVEMSWHTKVKGILQTWYLGSMAGNAIADVVSGDANPSGKLPFSFPKKLDDNGAHSFGPKSYPGVDLNQEYLEDILVGYRWHDTKKIKPFYAFGYGMSYTSFKTSAIKSNRKNYTENDTINITCEIKNTGSRDGAEVIQVYVGKQKSKVKRALKELKGFQKVSLKTQETKIVTIPIDPKKLAFYDETISGWNLEKGTYYVYVGTASNMIHKKIKIALN
jgi:beta-glucosidase